MTPISCVQNSTGTETKILSPLSITLSLSGIVALGDEGYLVALVNSTEHASNTTIQVSLPEGFLRIAGSLSWNGEIEKEREIEIGAKVRLLRTGNWIIRAEAVSGSPSSVFGKVALLYVYASEDSVITSTKPIFRDSNYVMQWRELSEYPNMTHKPNMIGKDHAIQQSTAGTITICGRWFFLEEDNTTIRPMRHVKVELWEDEWWGTQWLCDTKYTDDYGYYCFDPVVNDDGYFEGGLDLLVKLYLDNSVVKVVEDATGNMYRTETPIFFDLPDGLYSMPDYVINSTNRGSVGIFDTIDIGHEYAESVEYGHPKTEVRWPADDTQTIAETPLIIYLAGGDEWDEDIILHEYGHSIMFSIYGGEIPLSGGDHFWNSSTNANFAFAEGWPTFFGVAANFEKGHGDLLYPRDTHYKDHFDQIIDYNLESEAHNYGTDVEGAVTCLLWDIYDSSCDVLRHRQDSLSAGIVPMWDVFNNYLINAHHIYNIYPDFFHGWLDRGHDSYQVIWDIYYHHCLSIADPRPSTPWTVIGPAIGYKDALYTFFTNTTDRYADDIRYYFNWSDNTPQYITSWYPSGAVASASHSWSTSGTFNVTVQAEDIHGPLNASTRTNWAYYPLTICIKAPLCAMKTNINGVFYVPLIQTNALKIHLLFNSTNVVGDQVGTQMNGYPFPFPDQLVDIFDASFIGGKLGLSEGDANWDYMADIVPDRTIDIFDIVAAVNHFGSSGTYSTNLSGVTVTFNTGEERLPDQNGFIQIPLSATNLTVKRNGSPIGAMIIFWEP